MITMSLLTDSPMTIVMSDVILSKNSTRAKTLRRKLWFAKTM